MSRQFFISPLIVQPEPDPLRRKLVAGLVCAAYGALAKPVMAAEIPETIRLVIPYPAGGGTDIIGRLFAETGGRALRRRIVPENRGGADGLIGIRAVARAQPDGATLGISGIGTSVTLALTKKDMPYILGRDLQAVAYLGSFGNLLVVRAGAPYADLDAFLAAARTREKPFFCGTPSEGSPSYLTLHYLCAAAGVTISAVPYQGQSQIMVDLLGGVLDVALLSVPLAAEAVRSGQLKALAVTSGARSSVLPDVPTAHESGLKDFDASLWNVLAAPAGVPPDVLEELNRAVNAGFGAKAARATLATAGVDFQPYDLEQTTAFVEREKQKWRQIVTKAGIVPT